LTKARQLPSEEALFGYDAQGYDLYTRTVYGARASVSVGILATAFTLIFGSAVGIIAGYRGGWLDSVIGRIAEIFLAIPIFLGGLLFLFTFPNDIDTPFAIAVGKVAFVIAILAWPTITRLMRASVLQVKPNDYVQAARALGASPWRIITAHILPNSVASVIVVSTINLGVFISLEASLSFLGVGLQPPVISWGNMISDASGLGLIRAAPHMLLFPSLFLSLTVLSFIMLGDVVRDALDPRLR
jgi:oligopeptide transport system permease protein